MDDTVEEVSVKIVVTSSEAEWTYEYSRVKNFKIGTGDLSDCDDILLDDTRIASYRHSPRPKVGVSFEPQKNDQWEFGVASFKPVGEN